MMLVKMRSVSELHNVGGKVTGEKWIVKYMEEDSHGLIWMMLWRFKMRRSDTNNSPESSTGTVEITRDLSKVCLVDEIQLGNVQTQI
jgi:hypothetical protein